MRILVFSFLLMFALTPLDLAQNKNQVDALNSMVETERAFSRMSEEKGTRPAFAAFIADDGILFRPTPVLGKKWMVEHPLPPSTTRSLLTWQPIFAAVSLAGDFGYTTGPWQFKNDIKDAKPVAFGNFMTVWRKQVDGSWRFALDLGISNPDPKAPVGMWQVPPSIHGTGNPKAVKHEAERTGLLLVDREFSNASGARGAVEAFRSYASTEVRLFRNGRFPFVGKQAASDALVPLTNEWTWAPSFADVSQSGDLGYSYGIYELRETAGARAVVEKGNYARVWKKASGTWKLVIDVADPLPPEAKKN